MDKVIAVEPLSRRLTCPASHSVFLGHAQVRHGLRVLVEEHGLVMVSPRTG